MYIRKFAKLEFISLEVWLIA